MGNIYKIYKISSWPTLLLICDHDAMHSIYFTAVMPKHMFRVFILSLQLAVINNSYLL